MAACFSTRIPFSHTDSLYTFLYTRRSTNEDLLLQLIRSIRRNSRFTLSCTCILYLVHECNFILSGLTRTAAECKSWPRDRTCCEPWSSLPGETVRRYIFLPFWYIYMCAAQAHLERTQASPRCGGVSRPRCSDSRRIRRRDSVCTTISPARLGNGQDRNDSRVRWRLHAPVWLVAWPVSLGIPRRYVLSVSASPILASLCGVGGRVADGSAAGRPRQNVRRRRKATGAKVRI